MKQVPGQTLDQSSAPAALRVKALIRARIAAGDTKSEIKARLVDEFGERILAAPPRRGFNLLAWLLPLVGLLTGAVVVGIAAWRWSHDRDAEPELEASPDAASSKLRPLCRPAHRRSPAAATAGPRC